MILFSRSARPARRVTLTTTLDDVVPNTSLTEVNAVQDPSSSVPRLGEPGPSSSASLPATTTAEEAEELPSYLKQATCGICSDVVVVTKLPQHRFPPSSDKITGINMHRGREHVYCNTCLARYISSKLEEGKEKAMNVFPIPCPECSWWPIPDWMAESVLEKSEMEGMWWWARVFESTQTFYCPIGTCGVRIELPSKECTKGLKQANCPACKEDFCYRCQTKWHEGQSCAQHARKSGAVQLDKALRSLAKKESWRRCPKCCIVVERNEGCRHMTCRCGHQFCYRCGRQWGEGCGRRRSKVCFPVKFEMWPETRSRVVEMITDLFSWKGAAGGNVNGQRSNVLV